MQQVECLPVLHRNGGDIDGVRVAAGIYDANGPVDDRQGFEAEEVEFDEADRLDIVFVELRDDAATTVFAIERREVGQIVGCDNDTPGVLAGIAHEPFE